MRNAGDGGYSRQDFFGTIHHFDKDGKEIGTSRPGFLGGYVDYDAKGRRIGTTEEQIIGPGYTHYDNDHRKIGSSDERLFGGYTHRDARGRVTGHSERSRWDIKDEEEQDRTGSLYGDRFSLPGRSVFGKRSGGVEEDREENEEAGSTEWRENENRDPAPSCGGFGAPAGPATMEVGGYTFSEEDAEALRYAGYDEEELELMNGEERFSALEDAGVDTEGIEFDDCVKPIAVGGIVFTDSDAEALRYAGYEESDLEYMSKGERFTALEEAGIDTYGMEFDDM